LVFKFHIFQVAARDLLSAGVWSGKNLEIQHNFSDTGEMFLQNVQEDESSLQTC